MKLTLKQKWILYVGSVLIILMSLYANAFITDKEIENVKMVNNTEVFIYTE